MEINYGIDMLIRFLEKEFAEKINVNNECLLNIVYINMDIENKNNVYNGLKINIIWEDDIFKVRIKSRKANVTLSTVSIYSLIDFILINKNFFREYDY